MSCSFIALFDGPTPEEARVVALSADPQTVREFASRALYRPPDEDRRPDLRLIKDEEKAPAATPEPDPNRSPIKETTR